MQIESKNKDGDSNFKKHRTMHRVFNWELGSRSSAYLIQKSELGDRLPLDPYSGSNGTNHDTRKISFMLSKERKENQKTSRVCCCCCLKHEIYWNMLVILLITIITCTYHSHWMQIYKIRICSSSSVLVPIAVKSTHNLPEQNEDIEQMEETVNNKNAIFFRLT